MYRIALLCGADLSGVDAIAQHSQLLRRALAASGHSVDLHLRLRNGQWQALSDGDDGVTATLGRLGKHLAGYDYVVLQYNPFTYGRWGFAPWLPASFHRLRRRRRRPGIALIVHEPYVPIVSLTSMLMGTWQRAQLEALRVASDSVLTSIEAWADLLSRARPRRPTYHLPSGSNVPDGRASRDETRRRLGIEEDRVVLAAFGTNHPSRLVGHIVAAVNAVARRGHALTLLNLGAGAPALSKRLEPAVQLHEPGTLSAEHVASYLGAADIFLAPFIDGVSTRRTTFAAALQHGLAVVATDGPLTDDLLRRSDGARLEPVARPDRFAESVVRLAENRGERTALGHAGRALFERVFAWPALASRLLDALTMESSR